LSRIILQSASKDILRKQIGILSQSLYEFIGEGHLFTALDEAQALARRFRGHFRGRGLDGSPASRSIMKPLICAWTNLHCTCLISGTGLSLEVVQESVTSDSVNPGVVWEVFSNTGYFKDQEIHADYIKCHLPPNPASTMWKHFFLRAWRWLRGRCVGLAHYLT
jgi:hypothetical protein